MAKRTGPTNQNLKELIYELKKESSIQESSIWKRLAKDLEKPTRRKKVVNISRINRYSKENDTIIVPGKVLGSGLLDHSLIVAAFSFSQSAKDRIQDAKGKCLSIQELMKKNPKGSNIKIIG